MISSIFGKECLKNQVDINCGASSQADFILNYFLSNFLSNSPFLPSPAGRLEQSKPPCQQVMDPLLTTTYSCSVWILCGANSISSSFSIS